MDTITTSISAERHAKTRVIRTGNYEHAKDMALSVITINEFAAITADYPIFFTKEKETGQFRAVCLLGLSTGENAYFNNRGWNATYIPLNVSRYPFAVSYSDEDQSLEVCLMENSPLVSTSEGEALFDEFGYETGFMKNVRGRLDQMIEGESQTHRFLEKITALQLLAPATLVIKKQGEEDRARDGLYTINDKMLETLSADALFDLHSQGFLGPIYHSIGSRAQLQRLVQLNNACGFPAADFVQTRVRQD